MEPFDIQKIIVNRTTEGTIFEIASVAFLIAAWVVAIITHQIGFDEIKGSFVALVVVTIAVVCILKCAYHPRWIDIGEKKLENIRQVAIAIRLCRVLALELSIMLLMVTVTSGKFKLFWSIAYLGVAITIPIFKRFISQAT